LVKLAGTEYKLADNDADIDSESDYEDDWVETIVLDAD